MFIVDSTFFFLHVEVPIIFLLYDQKLVLVSGKPVNLSFVPRALATRAKRLATSLVAEAFHVIVPHSTKLSGSQRLHIISHFFAILLPHIVHWHIVYVHYFAIRLKAAMMTNPALHPFQSLLLSFCTFCVVGIMIIYCFPCLRFLGTFSRSLRKFEACRPRFIAF